MNTIPHLRTTARTVTTLRAWHSSARARALTAWHRELHAATFGLLIAEHPRWPLIEGRGKRFAPTATQRPTPRGAA